MTPGKEEEAMIEELYSDPRIAERHRAGPLGAYVDEFAAVLRTQGYAHQCICLYVRATGKFSRWMQRKDLSLEDVGEPHVVQFLQQRRRKARSWKRDRDALHCLIAWLRHRGLLSLPPSPEPTALDLLVSRFADYLSVERCLTDATVQNYCPVARLFLSERFDPDVLSLEDLSGKDVYDFVARHAHDHSVKRTQLMLSALRSFLRFCHLKGLTAGALAIHVPTVASWRLADVPRYLTADEIEKVLEACDQRTSIGRRDFAILTLLARLGLRAGEIVALTLDDVLWESGDAHGNVLWLTTADTRLNALFPQGGWQTSYPWRPHNPILGWCYVPVRLEPGQSWETQYIYGCARGLPGLTSASPDFAVHPVQQHFTQRPQSVTLQLASTRSGTFSLESRLVKAGEEIRCREREVTLEAGGATEVRLPLPEVPEGPVVLELSLSGDGIEKQTLEVPLSVGAEPAWLLPDRDRDVQTSGTRVTGSALQPEATYHVRTRSLNDLRSTAPALSSGGAPGRRFAARRVHINTRCSSPGAWLQVFKFVRVTDLVENFERGLG